MNDDAAQAILGLLGLHSTSPSLQTPIQESQPTLPAPSAVDTNASDAIDCICGFSYDDGFSIACDACSRWCHAACVGIAQGDVPDEWCCWRCNPTLRVDREAAIRLQRARQERERRRHQSPGVERKQRRISALEGSGKRKRRPSVSQQQQHQHQHQHQAATTQPTAPSAQPATVEDEFVDVDEPWTLSYVPIERDIIPDQVTHEKLRKSSHNWRGVSALGPPPSPSLSVQRLSSSSSHLSFGDASIRPPAFAVHTTVPRSPHDYITPYTSTILPSAAYLADPLNAYAHLSIPKPFVHLIGPPLDVALDARVTGNTARFIRSGCRPNAVLRPFLCGKDSDAEETGLAFGVFATKDMRANEEVVLGWEWDDGSAVHALPAVIASPETFPAHHLQHLKHQMASLMHSLSSTFATCACGSRTADCALARMAAFVDTDDDASPPPASPAAEHAPDGPRKRRRVDLGPLVGVERGFRTRERGEPYLSGGMNGVEMQPGPSGMQRSVSDSAPPARGAPSGKRRSTVTEVARAFRDEVPRAMDRKGKGRAIEVEVEEKDEVDMPPRFRKRWMHENLDMLKDTYRDNEGSVTGSDMEVDDTGRNPPQRFPPERKVYKPRSIVNPPSRPPSSLSRLLHPTPHPPSSPSSAPRAATTSTHTTPAPGPDTPSVAFSTLSLQSPAAQLASKWSAPMSAPPAPLVHPSSPSPALSSSLARTPHITPGALAPSGRPILAGPGVAGTFPPPVVPLLTVAPTHVHSSHSYARAGARAEGSRGALSFADLLNPTPTSPRSSPTPVPVRVTVVPMSDERTSPVEVSTEMVWGQVEEDVVLESMVTPFEELQQSRSSSPLTTSPPAEHPPTSSTRDVTVDRERDISMGEDHMDEDTQHVPTLDGSPVLDIYVVRPLTPKLAEMNHSPAPPPMEQTSLSAPIAPSRGATPDTAPVALAPNARSMSPLSSWSSSSSETGASLVPQVSVDTTISHAPTDFHASSPLSSIPSASSARRSPTPDASERSSPSASTVSMGSTPRSPSPLHVPVEAVGEKVPPPLAPNEDTVHVLRSPSTPPLRTHEISPPMSTDLQNGVTDSAPVSVTNSETWPLPNSKNEEADSLAPVADEVMPPAEAPQSAIQVEDADLSMREVTPPVEHTTPPRAPTPIVREATSPIQEFTSPSREPTPPHEPTLPPREPTPPPKEPTPPPQPKVKLSLRDFAARKKKQREKEEKERAVEPANAVMLQPTSEVVQASPPPSAAEGSVSSEDGARTVQSAEPTPLEPISSELASAEAVPTETTTVEPVAVEPAAVEPDQEEKLDVQETMAMVEGPTKESVVAKAPAQLPLPEKVVPIPVDTQPPAIPLDTAPHVDTVDPLALQEPQGSRQAKVEIIEASLAMLQADNEGKATAREWSPPPTPERTWQYPPRRPRPSSGSSREGTTPPPDTAPTPVRRMSAISHASQEDGEITPPPPPSGPKFMPQYAASTQGRTPPTQPRSFQQQSPVASQRRAFRRTGGGHTLGTHTLGTHTLGHHTLQPPPPSVPTGPHGVRPPSGPRALRAHMGGGGGGGYVSGANAFPAPPPAFGGPAAPGFAPRGPSADRARERGDRDRDSGWPAGGRGRGRGVSWGRSG